MVKTAHYKLLFYSKDDVLNPVRLANVLKINVNTVKKYLRILWEEGFVKPHGVGEYMVTEKGKKLINSINNIRGRRDAPSYILTDPSTGQAIPLSIKNYKQLYAVIKYGLVPYNILLEHIRRGYLIEWLRNSIGDQYLADLMERGKIKSIEDLLKYLDKVIDLIEEL